MKSKLGNLFELPSGSVVKVTYEGPEDLEVRGDRAGPNEVVGAVYRRAESLLMKQVTLRRDWFDEYAKPCEPWRFERTH